MSAPQASQRKGSFGCLGYGCLVAVVLLLVVLGGVATYLVYSVRNAVDTYSAEGPTTGDVAVAESAKATAAEKLQALRKLVSESGSAGSVTFTAAELTALAQELAGPRLLVELSGTTIRVAGSVQLSRLFAISPLARTILGARESRYMNADGSAKLLLLVDEPLPVRVELQSLSFNSKPVEGDALVQAAEWFSGWASGLALQPSKDGQRNRLSRLDVSDNALTIGIAP